MHYSGFLILILVFTDPKSIICKLILRKIWEPREDNRGLIFEWIPKSMVDTRNYTINKYGIKIISTSPSDIYKIVKSHNHYRCHVSPPASDMLKLRWLEEAAHLAVNRVEQCYKGHDSEGERTPQEFKVLGCGQNIAYTPSLGGWEDIIVMWFKEGDGFRYGGPQNGLPIKHYTQLVWSSTNYVGCAMAICPNDPYNRTYHWVCNYCPKGNIKGEMDFPYIAGHKQSCKLCLGRRRCTRGDEFTGKLFEKCDSMCQNIWGSCKNLYEKYGCAVNTSLALTIGQGCPRQCNLRCRDAYNYLKEQMDAKRFRKIPYFIGNRI
ncbi:unnamed protein product [Gordionus sp. m RMFG-2023]|uniref:cysteine-rich venom protein VAR8-like n=1 Tax=Gordionus sp. m RMFG-2023 TaxID=3053472 RepID=UPI0030DFD58F